jgi:RHS repeat-associated protein
MEFAFADAAGPGRLQRLWSREHAISFGYDERGRLQTVADSLGRVLRVRRNSQGRMQQVLISDPTRGLSDRIAAEYEYDDAGRLVRTTDPYGHHLAYAYDKTGRLARFTDRNGYSFHYEYDPLGRCTYSRGDDGVEEVRLTYDPDARMTVVKRHAHEWQYFYDQSSALTQVIDPSGGITEYQYDDEGKLLAEIDPAKNVTSYEYSSIGALRVVVSPTGHARAPGDDPDPFVPLMRRYRVHRTPLPGHALHGWAPSTPARWQLGSLLRAPFHLPVADTRLPFVSTEDWSLLTRADRPNLGGVTEVLDAYGLLVREERSDGRARQYHYDANGNRARITDFDGSHYRYEHASWNLLAATVDPLGARSVLRYDVNENLTCVRDAGGNTNDYSYDACKHLVESRKNGVVRERYENDGSGRVVARLAPDGNRELQIQYDDRGLIRERTLASGDRQQFEYGNLGALARCTSAAGELDFAPTIDGGYRTRDLRDGIGLVHELTWGGVDTTQVLGSFELEYYPFPDGSTQMVVAPGDRAHRIRRCGSGVIRFELHGGATEVLQFDPQGRLLARLRTDPRGQRHDTIYSYSGEGDLLQVSDSERGLTRYEYDAAHRLVGVHEPGSEAPAPYEYDIAGNLTHMPGLNYFGIDSLREAPPADAFVTGTATHGIWLEQGNRLYRAHGQRFVYNDRGHVCERHGADRVLRYRYDSLDQLVEVDDGVAAPVRFEYDAIGRRTRKTVGQDSWTYYWNGDRLAAEQLPDGRVRVYVYADLRDALVPFSFVEFASVDSKASEGVHYFFAVNHLGAPEIVTDERGRVVWRAVLEPYGAARVLIGEDFYQPLRAPGHFYDSETGLHYNRYRYYAPDLGRYLQCDPIDVEGGHNLYAYAQDGNPLRDVDLLGLICPIAKKLLAEAEDSGLINPDGTPGTPNRFSDMSDAQRQLFCAARAAQLATRLEQATMRTIKVKKGSDKTKDVSLEEQNTTINVRMVQDNRPDADGNLPEPTLIVSSSNDNGQLPAPVADSLNENERPADGAGPDLRRRKVDGKETTVDAKTGEPYDRGGDRNPNGQTDHHAEQRANAATDHENETVLADGPSRPCCGGCQNAIDTDKVHPELRQTKASQQAANPGP